MLNELTRAIALAKKFGWPSEELVQYCIGHEITVNDLLVGDYRDYGEKVDEEKLAEYQRLGDLVEEARETRLSKAGVSSDLQEAGKLGMQFELDQARRKALRRSIGLPAIQKK